MNTTGRNKKKTCAGGERGRGRETGGLSDEGGGQWGASSVDVLAKKVGGKG